MIDYFYFVAFGAGILTFLSPCILPLIPSYISVITGMSVTQIVEGNKERIVNRKALLSSALFIIGFSAVFIGLGAGASLVGSVLRQYQVWISRIGGIFIVLMGLYVIGLLRIPFLDRERKVHLRTGTIGLWGTPLVGAAFAAGWTPCVGPILGSILFYASTTTSMWKGVSLLAVYSAGLAVPFLLTALALGAFLQRYARLRRHMRVVSLVSGLLLIGIGLLLLFDVLSFLNLDVTGPMF